MSIVPCAEVGSGVPADPPATRLRLFGGFALERSGHPLSTAASGQRLLAFLGLCGAASRCVVAGTLWPDVAEEHADGSLRTAIWRLHRGSPNLVERRSDVLSLSAAVAVDTRAFTAAALRVLDTDPLAAGAVGSDGPASPTELMDAGELLPGWYDDWVLFERERLRQLRLHALEVLATRLTAQHRYAAALEVALESVRAEPLRESAHRTVVAVHLAEGNVAEAVRHYRRFAVLLQEELQVEPSPRFTAMLPESALRRVPAGREPLTRR